RRARGGRGAGAAAAVAVLARREMDGLVDAERRLLEAQLEGVAEVAPCRLAPRASEEVEEVIEDLGDAEAGRDGAAGGPERAVAVAVVRGALVGIREDRVSLVG